MGGSYRPSPLVYRRAFTWIKAHLPPRATLERQGNLVVHTAEQQLRRRAALPKECIEAARASRLVVHACAQPPREPKPAASGGRQLHMNMNMNMNTNNMHNNKYMTTTTTTTIAARGRCVMAIKTIA